MSFGLAERRKRLLLRMKRIIDLSHQGGAFVFHHNDVAIRRILPDMTEASIDLLNPIQWRCGSTEREALKRDFGGRAVFHGGMDNLRVLGAGGGSILAPRHNIQSLTPPENIVATYETCYDNGWM